MWAPDCFCTMKKAVRGSRFDSMYMLRSMKPSSTDATSRRRTGWPPFMPTMVSAISATAVNSPGTRSM